MLTKNVFTQSTFVVENKSIQDIAVLIESKFKQKRVSIRNGKHILVAQGYIWFRIASQDKSYFDAITEQYPSKYTNSEIGTAVKYLWKYHDTSQSSVINYISNCLSYLHTVFSSRVIEGYDEKLIDEIAMYIRKQGGIKKCDELFRILNKQVDPMSTKVNKVAGDSSATSSSIFDEDKAILSLPSMAEFPRTKDITFNDKFALAYIYDDGNVIHVKAATSSRKALKAAVRFFRI
ncbi:hypothetical protein [Shewanella aestuarii]|uniref:Uncharacterized protein n=1 Tax=Shewanella aestuarii TaxID=1028752 RepID=A0A6G9QGA7_9GAMM|nr:hypothetical protein [Shewanella aestuarii]QIR13574.1 hypothetical protein HBH39_02830 [Shewanella aestuarii]